MLAAARAAGRLSEARRKALLAGKVEDMINTVVRQIAFYDFECKLHAARAQGELTPEDINALWMSVQAQSLGDAFEFMDGYETFWSYIPHFVHSPFYVYAYAFGDGLVNALYAAYAGGLPDFQEKYFAMLKAGGIELLWHPSLSHGSAGSRERMLDAVLAGEQVLDILCVEGSIVTAPRGTGLYRIRLPASTSATEIRLPLAALKTSGVFSSVDCAAGTVCTGASLTLLTLIETDEVTVWPIESVARTLIKCELAVS